MKQWLAVMSVLVPIFLIGANTGSHGCIKRAGHAKPAGVSWGPKPEVYRTPAEQIDLLYEKLSEADETISTLLNK